jgi:hypothetical protein
MTLVDMSPFCTKFVKNIYNAATLEMFRFPSLGSERLLRDMAAFGNVEVGYLTTLSVRMINECVTLVGLELRGET